MNKIIYKVQIVLIAISLASCSKNSDDISTNANSSTNQSIFIKDKKPKFTYKEKAAEISSENQFIKSHMYDSYAEYDADYGCWNLDKEKEKDSYINYCMEIKRIHDVDIDNKKYKFVEVNGLYVNEKGRIDPDGAPHVAAGISGLYVFIKDNKKWNLLSKIPEFHSQTWGQSGVDESSFTKFGPDVYGWKISGGGMWQGQIYDDVSYIALVDNHLAKILDFPLSFNADGFGNKELIKENYEGEIVINHNKTINGLFVLDFNYSSYETNKKYSISFNKEKNRYLYPAELSKIECGEIISSSPRHIEKMGILHKIVGLPGDYFNKYHELVVESICKKDDKNIQLALDNNWISTSDVDLIRSILTVD
jgi:hypothetical protein